MKKVQVVVIPNDNGKPKHFKIPSPLLKVGVVASLLFCFIAGYFAFDYYNLINMRTEFLRISAENQGLKGEAKIFLANLEDVKKSLRRVEDYAGKLTAITNVQMKKVSQKTGIGPLTQNEHVAFKSQSSNDTPYMPLGIQLDKLVFKTLFNRLDSVGNMAETNAFNLQQLLSSLGQKKSLLSSLPSISPVNGWLASGFGTRISPFTGKKTMHSGVDLASPIGTPVFAPANGVVIFSGTKIGFGNFIMIAHGNGVVSRYGHNAQNLVEPGQKVKRGEQIATVGMTGRTTGPHLHYEILVNGKHADPKKFMLNL